MSIGKLKIGDKIARLPIIQGGMGVGVNVMVALKHYREHVRAAVEAGADVVICGAGIIGLLISLL